MALVIKYEMTYVNNGITIARACSVDNEKWILIPTSKNTEHVFSDISEMEHYVKMLIRKMDKK